MVFQAKNGRIRMDNTEMDFVVFGEGSKNLVLIPGIGDGLKTVRGMALLFSILYRQYAKSYRVYVFSRKRKLEKGYTTRTMARDLARGMKVMGVQRADVIGISQGGMVAQFLAIDYPCLVNKLVLVSTTAKAGPRIKRRVAKWIKLVKEGDYQELLLDIGEKMYSEDYRRRSGWLFPIGGKLLSGGDRERFCTMARACVTHDALAELDKIKAETLVIGAGRDRVAGSRGTKQLAEGLPGSRFILYPDGEHGFYDEVKDFHRTVLEYLNP